MSLATVRVSAVWELYGRVTGGSSARPEVTRYPGIPWTQAGRRSTKPHRPMKHPTSHKLPADKILSLGYALELPGRKSGLRARFRPDSIRKKTKSGPPAGRRPAGGLIWMPSGLESGPEVRLLARMRYCVTSGRFACRYSRVGYSDCNRQGAPYKI